jgi:hypothetical protein
VRSPLECIEGSYEHAVFCTYSINLRFFEEWMLPLLRASGVRNITVLADEAQLGVALTDRSLRSIGRSYHVVSVRLGPGAFHPKLFLLAGEAGARACVTSANLTVDGQLRNVEGAIALDSSVREHRTPIADLASFVRVIVEQAAPAHSAEAVMAALEAVDAMPADRPVGQFSVVHNLNQPLLELFPKGGLTAVTPYADSGEAASALAALGELTVVTDADGFAAPETFFAGKWSVFGLDFDKRRLHGKAYWGETQSWLLLGSPNLSRQALLQTAREANTELAVVLAPHDPQLPQPPGTPVADGEQLAHDAPARHALARSAEADVEPEPGSFNAWEDERAIVVEGVPAGASIDYWYGGTWHVLGTVLGDRVAPPDDVRPYLIRWVAESGRARQAIVHRTDQLRIHRLRPRSTSRAADVVTTLPLDLAGVQALESVLRDLYLLGSIADDEGEEQRLRERLREREDEPADGLGAWMPARPEDEPRVPDIYRRAWQNQPDALLALIRGALRLESVIETPEEEWDVFEESLDFDDADRTAEQEADETALHEVTPPAVERNVLTRYRNSLVGLLRRGTDFVRDVRDPDLADLGFQSVLGLHDRIERSPVEVDGQTETLVEIDELLRQKLSLLDAYLRSRDGREPVCLATARVHLAKCLGTKSLWTPLEREQLETIAYRSSATILASDAYAAAAAADAGESLAEISELLRPYAERSAWDGYLTQADEILDNADIRTDPFICVEGDDWVEALESSPAWRLIGYGAIAGFRDRQPYAVLIRNSLARSNYLAHLLICEPKSHRVHELFQRAADRRWLARTYSPVEEGDVDDAGKFGAEGLLQAGASRSAFKEITSYDDGAVGRLLAEFVGERVAT